MCRWDNVHACTETARHLVLRSRMTPSFANSSSWHSHWTAAVRSWARWPQQLLAVQPHERQGQCQKVAHPPLPRMRAQQCGQLCSYEPQAVTGMHCWAIFLSQLSIRRNHLSHSRSRFRPATLTSIAPPAPIVASGVPAHHATRHAGPRRRRIAASMCGPAAPKNICDVSAGAAGACCVHMACRLINLAHRGSPPSRGLKYHAPPRAEHDVARASQPAQIMPRSCRAAETVYGRKS